VGREKFLSIPLIKRVRFAAYVRVLSGIIALVGLIVYFWARLREPYAAFEVLLVFALAIVVFPPAVILRDARRKRTGRGHKS
jgi:hypothetical protein